MLYHWNDGAPRKARVTGSGNRRRLTLPDGRTLVGAIGADPALDLYTMAETGPTPGLYERAGTSAYAKAGTVITKTRSVEDIPLADAKALHKVAATARFRVVRDGGVDLTVGEDTVVLATTHEARIEIKTLVERLSGEDTQKGVTRSGALIAFTETLAVSALAAIDDHHAAANAREYDLHDAIDGCADVDAVRAVDIASGWPTNAEDQ